VVAVVERANRTVVGVAQKQGRQTWVIPDNKRLPPILLVGRGRRPAAVEKAAVLVSSFGSPEEPPLGTLCETFGRADTRQAAVEAALYQYRISPQFPDDVLAQAEQTPSQVPQQAIEGRRDLRGETIITIDGASAKDLDDAVSLTRDGQGRRVLGVHIADVSHYVPTGSPLDREAWERGTSVYFADRVVPMLPPALSNGICSLHPQVDRLTLSCLMTLDEDGAVVDQEIVKSVIRSNQRMTYEDCNTLLDGTDPALETRYAPILPLLRELDRLAGQLKKRRRLRGSLELERSEAVVLCDETGRPVGVELRCAGRAESLIEECMLCANETVARTLDRLGKPAVYRVHEKPSEDKVARLRTMLAPFGLELRTPDHFSFQKVLDAVKGQPQEAAVHTMVLRSMMKARYDVEDLGHFGLAAPHYCHFTSPIRRYPDLMVHRCLTALLDGTLQGSAEKKLLGEAGRAAVQSSQREIAAQNAEREIEKFYMAEFMQDHVGEVFPGTVSGVTRFGLFVLLPFGVEGMVPTESLPGDRYRYDEDRMTLTGRDGTVFSFAMPLEVECVSADPGSGQIEFRLSGTPERPKKPRQESALPKRKPGKKPGKRPSVPRKRKRR
jgi:ribonuclease R